MGIVLLLIVPMFLFGAALIVPLIGAGFIIGTMIKYWWLAGPLILLGFICSKIED